MSDLFKAKGSVGGVFKGTTVALTLGKGDAGGTGGQKGALVQNIGLSYTRNVTRVWELGSRDTFYVVGHTEGTAQLTKIVAKTDADILDSLADACTAKDNTLNMSGVGDTCDGQANFSLKAGGPVLTQRSFSIDAGQYLISSTAALMFATLEKP